MKDLQALTETAKSMLSKVNCAYRKFTIVSSSRMTRNWGRCKRVRGLGNPRFAITVADVLLGDDVPESSALTTIAHEILHTVDGCMNHGWKWKWWASRVNERFGLKIKLSTTSAEKGDAVFEARQATFKWRAYCPKCGREWKRNNYCRIIAEPYEFSCPLCHCALRSERIQMA